MRGGFPFSKPPPSATRPPHRARKLSSDRLRVTGTLLWPKLSLQLSLPGSQHPPWKSAVRALWAPDPNAAVLFADKDVGK
jgi:hypothetical protein